MSIVLADTKNSPVARQAAGLQLKNCLTSRDVSLKEKYQRRWANLPEKSRNDVRDRLFSSLGTENIFPSCAAQCIAYIGAAELLLETQPSSEITCLENVLSELSGIVTQPANERRKEAALDSIACISQEIVS
jgi:importin subunit beta-1